MGLKDNMESSLNFTLEHSGEFFHLVKESLVYMGGKLPHPPGRERFNNPEGLKYAIDTHYGDIDRIEDLLNKLGIDIRLEISLMFLLTEEEYNYIKLTVPELKGSKNFLTDHLNNIRTYTIKWVEKY